MMYTVQQSETHTLFFWFPRMKLNAITFTGKPNHPLFLLRLFNLKIINGTTNSMTAVMLSILS